MVEGVYVRSIESFSAAEKAGIQAGDVVIEADGTAIEVLWINPSNTLLVGGTSSSSLGTIQFQTDNLVTKSGKRVA